MEVGLMERVRSVNRRWIYGSYFSLYRPIHPRRNVRGNCPNTEKINTDVRYVFKVSMKKHAFCNARRRTMTTIIVSIGLMSLFLSFLDRYLYPAVFIDV